VRALLDTHVLLWWVLDSPRLAPVHAKLIADRGNDIFVSSVTAVEIAIKTSIGKLPELIEPLSATLRAEGFSELPLTVDHAEALGQLPPHHADPFDRMLIAQAIVEDLVLLTADRRLSRYEVRLG
jgi:PIN domain nuclease of toxin-antitoxin system